MRTARSEADVVVVSLFVNPTQFGPGEDLARYPRRSRTTRPAPATSASTSCSRRRSRRCIRPGFATSDRPGARRARPLGIAPAPGHFAGVATVVTRLFGIVAPDIAYFGLKDFQQVAVIRRLVRRPGAADRDPRTAHHP